MHVSAARIENPDPQRSEKPDPDQNEKPEAVEAHNGFSL